MLEKVSSRKTSQRAQEKLKTSGELRLLRKLTFVG